MAVFVDKYCARTLCLNFCHLRCDFLGNDLLEAVNDVCFRLLRIVQYNGDNTRSVYVGWQMNKMDGIYSLQFSPVNSDDWLSFLPQDLIMLDSRTDNRELVKRALVMTTPMQHEIHLRIWKEMGMEPAREYKIVDVECSRRKVKILYRKHNSEDIYSSCFTLADYPALRAITVHSDVELLWGICDGKLYAFWNNLGVLIPLVS